LNEFHRRHRFDGVKRTNLLATLAVLMSMPAAALADEGPKVRFIRVDEDANAARLQTAVTRYEKDGASVDLIGAIHIADKAYYEELGRRFEKYDALLFEMVGGEKFGRREAAAREPAPEEKTGAEPADPKAAEKKPAGQSALHQVYKMVSSFLGLTGQMEQIDYSKPNFVHADLTQAEFEKMQKERGESILGFALKSAQDPKAAKNQPDPDKLLKAMLSGRSNLMKLEIVHTLGQGDDQIGALAGESVILTDRNTRCLEVIERELKAERKQLGVFYGAAHFTDLARRLEEKGFRRANQEWLTAWDIPKPKEAPKAAPEKNAEPAAPAKQAA
jgi:hypothetical protein